MIQPQPSLSEQPDYSFLFQPLKMKDSVRTNVAKSVSSSELSSLEGTIAGHTPVMVEGCEGAYIDYLDVPLSVISRELKAPKRKRKGPRGGVVRTS